MILKLGLFIYASYLLLYLFLIWFIKNKNHSYSYKKHMVSSLASLPKPWGQFFNLLTFLYGLLSFVLPVAMIVYLVHSSLVVLDSVLIGMTGIAAILIALFPVSKNAKSHEIVGFLAFFQIIMTAGIFILIQFRQGLFSTSMLLLSAFTILVTILFLIAKVFNLKNCSVFEWILFISTIVWNFALSMFFYQLK